MTADREAFFRPHCPAATVYPFFVAYIGLAIPPDLKPLGLLCLYFTAFTDAVQDNQGGINPDKTYTLPFGLGMLGERLGLSKARSNFGSKERNRQKQNSCASPRGRPLTDCALALPFRLRRKAQRNYEKYPLVGV